MDSIIKNSGEGELHILLGAEREAQRLEGEARALKDGMPGRIAAERARIMAESNSAAERAISEAKAMESARADAEISRIQADVAAKLERLRERFAAAREEYTGRIFAIVTGQADE